MPDLDHIEVRGARENNLRDVSVDIPKRAIAVFTGVWWSTWGRAPGRTAARSGR
jgi:excinuclease UvrABC ATPase subunit